MTTMTMKKQIAFTQIAPTDTAKGLARSGPSRPASPTFVGRLVDQLSTHGAENDDGPDPETRWLTITPAVAKELLEKNNGRNRALREERAERYARDMAGGTWLRKAGDPIRFSPDGSILDGQHRFSAVVRANRPIRFLVLGEVPSEVQRVIDRQGRRTDADDLVIAGKPRYAQEHAAWIRVLHTLTTGKSGPMTFGEKEAVERRFARAIAWGLKNIPTGGAVKNAPIFGAVVFAYQAAPTKVAEFASRLRNAHGHEAGSPALALREYATRCRTVHQPQGVQSAKALRAVQAHINGERISRLEVKSGVVEQFRSAYGLSQ